MLRPWIAEGADAVLVLAAGLALGRNGSGTVQDLAVVEELAVKRGCGGDPQGVARAVSYGLAVVECGPLGVVQFGGTQEVATLPGMSRVMGSSGAGTGVLAASCSGRRSATAVRMAPRLTW